MKHKLSLVCFINPIRLPRRIFRRAQFFSARRKFYQNFRHAENILGAPKKNSSRRKKIRRAENILGAPKKNSSRRKYFGHGKKKFVAPKIFWARRKKIHRAENISTFSFSTFFAISTFWHYNTNKVFNKKGFQNCRNCKRSNMHRNCIKFVVLYIQIENICIG